MGDSSSDEESNWVFYRDRPEWKDVTPVEQDEGESAVVAISYTDKFKDVYDYFRAILKSSEKSERALSLTQDAAALNPANYTVWHYRREILKALNKDLQEELEYSKRIIELHPKNYQVWHHRRVLVEWLKDASKELYFTELILSQDAKNYHAWQHRQWAIKTFNLYSDELNFVDQLLMDDIRNNSAWNQRYFVINNTTGFTEEVVKSEIEYTLEKIKFVKENESAWSYLRGLLIHDKNGLSENATVTQFAEDLYASGNRSTFLLAFLVDMCNEQVLEGKGDTLYTLDRGLALCKDLANEHDKIRAKYWEQMADMLKSKLKCTNGPARDGSEQD